MAKRKIEKNIEKLIVYKNIASVTGSISDRAKRRYDKVGEETCKRLKSRQIVSEDSGLVARLGWSDDAVSWARNISLALEEFKQKYPKYGERLQEIIGKHREVRRNYLEFGLKEGDLVEEIYIESIKEIIEGISDERAKKFYEIIIKLKEELGKKKKKKQGLFKYHLPE